MAQAFELNKPVTTQASSVDVVNNLAPGVHTFTLVVVDEEGNQSDLARATVTVRNQVILTGPVIDTTGPVLSPGGGG